MRFELVKTISNNLWFSEGKRAPAMLLPHEAKYTLPTHFLLNAMATTAYHIHNQFYKRPWQVHNSFLYGSASSCAEFSYAL